MPTTLRAKCIIVGKLRNSRMCVKVMMEFYEFLRDVNSKI